MVTPKRLPDHIRRAQHDLADTIAALHRDDPRLLGEQVALGAAVLERAKRWITEPIRVPPGAELVQYLDADDRPAHTIEWTRRPAGVPHFAFDHAAVAVEFAWTVFRLQRPWEITDERLRELVEHPPASPARLFGDLLAVRFAEWIRVAMARLSEVCIEHPPPVGVDALEELIRSLGAERERYDARATVIIHGLLGLLDLPESNASHVEECERWRWMLLDYAAALDAGLHRCVLALEERLGGAEHSTIPEAWNDLADRRRLDACTGVLLARAVANDPHHDPRKGPDFIDPMATRAVGSMAWWCQLLLIVLEELDQYPLGDRLDPADVQRFTGFCIHELKSLDPALLEALVRVFPATVARAPRGRPRR